MSVTSSTTPKKSGKWKSSILWIVPLNVIILTIIAESLDWIELSIWAWIWITCGFLACCTFSLFLKTEEKPVEEDKSKEKKKDEKPKEDHHHHHEPSWWTKFFARTIVIFGILYFFLIWVPEAKQALKDKYNSIMNSETSSSEEDPDGPLSVQYTPKEVVVTSSGFTKITSELRDFKLSISGSSWTVFVSNVDGSNEKSYDQDHLGDLKLDGPHRYRFVAKEGTVAVLKYTYVPHK